MCFDFLRGICKSAQIVGNFYYPELLCNEFFFSDLCIPSFQRKCNTLEIQNVKWTYLAFQKYLVTSVGTLVFSNCQKFFINGVCHFVDLFTTFAEIAIAAPHLILICLSVCLLFNFLQFLLLFTTKHLVSWWSCFNSLVVWRAFEEHSKVILQIFIFYCQLNHFLTHFTLKKCQIILHTLTLYRELNQFRSHSDLLQIPIT